MGRIAKKILFMRKLVGLSADLPSAIALLHELAFLSIGRHIGKNVRPFEARVRVGSHSSLMRFTGTMSELMTLADIFADDNYAPKHGHEQALFNGHISSMLDLGANIGIASVWFALKYPGIRIDAYEPNPELCALLRDNLAAFQNVTVYEEAVAGEDGTAQFSRSEYSLESSLFGANNSESITVTTTSLDTAIGRINDVQYIKMDIEGAEFDAFAHSKLLPHVRAIIGEAHLVANHTQEELASLLSPFNIVEIYNPEGRYKVFGFYAARLTA